MNDKVTTGFFSMEKIQVSSYYNKYQEMKKDKDLVIRSIVYDKMFFDELFDKRKIG